MAATLTGYKLFRHTSDISVQDYAWCVANAALLYSGTALTFADTGLIANTTYYYKLFVEYDVDGFPFYSEGLGAIGTTDDGPPLYQPWDNYVDSPVLTASYPYQCIWNSNILWVSTAPLYVVDYGGSYWWIKSSGTMRRYSGGISAWTFDIEKPPNSDYNMGWSKVGSDQPIEANNPVYANSTLSSVYFAKTT